MSCAFFSNQPFVGVDIHEVESVSSNTIFGDVVLPLPPPSFANHGSFVDFHPYVDETTPPTIVVIGDLAEPREPNKKKPKKTKWEINRIY